MNKLSLWENNINERSYGCFGTFETNLIENTVKVPQDIINDILDYLRSLKSSFYRYFNDEMKNNEKIQWVSHESFPE